MNSRKRLLTALSRGVPDRVPRDLSWGFSPAFYEKFKQNTGATDYENILGLIIATCGLIPRSKQLTS